MMRKTVWIIGIMAAIAMVSGCKNDAPPEPVDEPVKTAEELKAEAETQITEDNWQEELDRLEQEVKLDIDTQE